MPVLLHICSCMVSASCARTPPCVACAVLMFVLTWDTNACLHAGFEHISILPVPCPADRRAEARDTLGEVPQQSGKKQRIQPGNTSRRSGGASERDPRLREVPLTALQQQPNSALAASTVIAAARRHLAALQCTLCRLPQSIFEGVPTICSELAQHLSAADNGEMENVQHA